MGVDVRAEVLSDYLVVLSARDDDDGAPPCSEVAAFEGDPVATSSTCCRRSNLDAGREFATQAEVQLEGRNGQTKRIGSEIRGK